MVFDYFYKKMDMFAPEIKKQSRLKVSCSTQLFASNQFQTVSYHCSLYGQSLEQG